MNSNDKQSNPYDGLFMEGGPVVQLKGTRGHCPCPDVGLLAVMSVKWKTKSPIPSLSNLLADLELAGLSHEHGNMSVPYVSQ